MKNLISLAALTVLAMPLVACNESFHEDARDVRASEGAVRKDEAAKREYQRELAADRAEKAQAKAKGDTVKQAGKSLEIGANKAMINAKEVEKDIDRAILEEDKDDLRN